MAPLPSAAERAGATTSRFAQLLQELARAHETEVAALETKILDLKKSVAGRLRNSLTHRSNSKDVEANLGGTQRSGVAWQVPGQVDDDLHITEVNEADDGGTARAVTTRVISKSDPRVSFKTDSRASVRSNLTLASGDSLVLIGTEEPPPAGESEEAPKKQLTLLRGYRDVLREYTASQHRGTVNKLLSARQDSKGLKDSVDEKHMRQPELFQSGEGCSRRFIASPSSPVRVAWDVIGALLIMYDIVIIPLLIFEPPFTNFTDGMDWFAMVFWTVNIPATLTVGYSKNGVTVMVPGKIASHYLKTWFIVDMLVVLPDWIFTVVASGDSGKSVKLLRMLRMARSIRLLRLLKLKWILDGINDLLDSEVAGLFFNIVKMVFMLLVINHFVAAGWFLVASLSDSEDVLSWPRAHGFQNSAWNYKYLTAFHWSITQFTPSSMHVQPQNITERTYAICVVVFALVGFSYIVGSITGSLATLRGMSQEADKQFWQLRRFLRRNSVPIALSIRIQRYVEHAYSSIKAKMSIGDIKMLSLVSEQLDEELQFALNMPHLKVHPLINSLSGISLVTAQRIAKQAVHRIQLAKLDVLFTPDERALHVYFVISGRMLYTKYGHSDREDWVDRGQDWIAEPALWASSWSHLGELIATSECDMVSVEPDIFCRVVNLIKPVATVVARYAEMYLRWLQTLDPEDVSDIAHSDRVGAQLTKFAKAAQDMKQKQRFSLVEEASKVLDDKPNREKVCKR